MLKLKSSFSVISVLIGLLLPCFVLGQVNQKNKILQGDEASDWITEAKTLRINPQTNALKFMRFKSGSNVSAANFFSKYDNFFRKGTFQKTEDKIDEQNISHLGYQQYFKGVKVEGGTFFLHLQNGDVQYANGTYFNDFEPFDTANAISRNLAKDSALNWLNNQMPYGKEIDTANTKMEMLITGGYPNGSKHRLAYKVTIPVGIEHYEVYINALNGTGMDFRSTTLQLSMTANWLYNNGQTIHFKGSKDSTGRFILKDTIHDVVLQTDSFNNDTTGSREIFTNNSTGWGNYNQVATSAHFASEQTIEFLHHKQNITGYGNVDQWNILIDSASKDQPSGSKGAYFFPTSNEVLIDYDTIASNAPASIDIVGHEHGHGLVLNQSNLEDREEYGALNESLADINGVLTEFYYVNNHNTTYQADWLSGEDVFPGGLRNLANPKSTAISGPRQPDTYYGDFWFLGSSDDGGIHINSGVINYWFYLLSKGGTGTNDLGHQYQINGIGKDSAANIVYDVILNSLSQYTDFHDFYLLTKTRAELLYGTNSYAKNQTKKAWKAVGIPFDSSYIKDWFAEHYLSYPVTGTSCTKKRNGLNLAYLSDSLQPSIFLPSTKAGSTSNPDTSIFQTFKKLDSADFQQYTLIPKSTTPQVNNACFADLDRDGDQDLFMTGQYSDTTIGLWYQQSNGNFKQVTRQKIGYAFAPSIPRNECAIADFNRDGFFDILVANDQSPLLLKFDSSRNKPFQKHNPNNDALTNFTTNSKNNLTFCNWGDFNGDLYPDVFIGTKKGAYVFKNEGDGTFTKTRLLKGNYHVQTGNWTDLDNDGKLEVIFGSVVRSVDSRGLLGYGNYNNGQWDTTIIKKGYSHHVTAIGDFNNDRFPEIFAGNFREDFKVDRSNFLYIPTINNQYPTYNNVLPVDLTLIKEKINGAAWHDWNDDGALDLTVSSSVDADDSATRCPNDKIYYNKRQNLGNWLKVQLIGTISNEKAIGSHIKIVDGQGINQFDKVKYISTKTGGNSQTSYKKHFGLGNENNIDTLRVKWPSGIVQTLNDVQANQTLHLIENRPVVKDDTTCYGTSTTLEARFGNNIKWFDTPRGGTPIYNESFYRTPKLYQPQTYYVTNTSDSGHTSPRIPIQVHVDTPPPITLIGDTLQNRRSFIGKDLEAIPTYDTNDIRDVTNYENFQWFRNGDSIKTSKGEQPEYTPKKAGEYFMIAQFTCQNRPLDVFRETQRVRVYPYCDTNDYNTKYANGGNIGQQGSKKTVTNPLLIGDTLAIKPGSTVEFQGGIQMKPFSEIIVKRGNSVTTGAKMILQDITVKGCGDWQGITVKGLQNSSSRKSSSPHGKIEINNSTVKNANLAVNSIKGGIQKIQTSSFENNFNHIAFKDYGFSHNSLISNNNFDRLYTSQPKGKSCLNDTLLNSKMKKMVYLDSVKGIDFKSNEYHEKLEGIGIIPNKNIVEVYNSQNILWKDEYFSGITANKIMLFSNNSLNDTIKQCNFNLYYTTPSGKVINSKCRKGIHFKNGTKELFLTNNKFTGPFHYGIHGKKSDRIKITNNEFGTFNNGLRTPYNGIFLEDIKGGEIFQNTFKGLMKEVAPMPAGNHEDAKNLGYPILPTYGVALQTYMPKTYSKKPLTIQKNEVDSSFVGLMIAPDTLPLNYDTKPLDSNLNQSPHRMNIRVTCNTFERNQVGMIGSGNLRNQVHVSPDTSASNFFNDPSTQGAVSKNHNWDILWQADPNGNAFTYVWNDKLNPSYYPNQGANLDSNSITINGIQMQGSNHLIDSASEAICPITKRQKRASQKELSEKPNSTLNFKVYPNPTDQKLNIRFNKRVTGILRLVSTQGQTVKKIDPGNQKQMQVTTNQLSAGLYFLKGHIHDRAILPKQVIIMK